METFALARDRAKSLEQLVPGTDEHWYFQSLLLQHEGKLTDVDPLLDAWYRKLGQTQRHQEIANRQTLLRHAKDPKKAIADLTQRLGVSFHHQREVPDQKPEHPTKLDPGVLSEKTIFERGFSWSSGSTLSGFSERAIFALLDRDLEGDRRRELLQRVTRPDHPKLVERIAEDLAHRYSGGFGSLAIHGLLTLEQLDDLAKRIPELLTNANWVHAKVARLRPGPESTWQSNPQEREAYLERLWRFVGTLPPAFNSLKAHVLYHRLELDRARGTFDRGRFLTYLGIPRSVGYAEPKWINKKEHKDVLASLGQSYESVTLLPTVSDDERLVREHLEAFLEKAETWQPFEQYVREDWLTRVFATTKLQAGQGDPEKFYALLDPGSIQTLKDRVDIEFCPTNKAHVKADESVSVDVWIKNVPTLVVKVFEINAFNFLLARGREVDASIDLDGLVATEEQTHASSDAPIRRSRRTFAFPALKKPGTYVIELIGNGKSSRAVVRKGRLRFVERLGAAGHVFTVLDEANRPLSDATLWLDGREFRPNENGTMTVPYSTSPGRRNVILRHGELATLESFEHKAESYGFSAGIHVDRESLIERQKAQVLVRPSLTLNGVPVNLELLEEPRLVIESRDHAGTASTKEVPIEVAPDKETVFTFQVPEDLSVIQFTVKAKVKSITTGSTVDLSDHRVYTLNAIDRTAAVDDVHLARTQAGYVLYLLGKSGEPRRDRPVTVTLAHELLTSEWQETLQTDERGRVELGHLPGVTELTVRQPSGHETSWPLARDACRQPTLLHVRAGEPIAIPYVGPAKELSRRIASLLERSGETFLRDHFARLALEGGFIEIAKGLDPGDYELLLKDSDQAIEIRVSDAPLVGGWLAQAARLLEAKTAKRLHVTAVEVSDSFVTVRLANTSALARVHAIATRFVPAHPVHDELGRLDLPQPRAALAGRAPSVYLSGRNLGDEYRYVLERKYAKKYPGNLLARPGLLLNPWAMRKTETQVQHAKGGGAFGAGAAAECMASLDEMDDRMGSVGAASGAHANLDFLAEPSVVLANLKPDEKGVVTIPRAALASANQVRVIALDSQSAITRDALLPECENPHKDRRLILGLDPQKPASEKKQVSVLAAGGSLVIEDLTTSKIEVYDTLARVHGLYATLSGDANLAQFAFVLRWPTFDFATKCTRASEFACHELHHFIARKDPEFFEKVTRPYLRNKRDKTFLDRWLIGDDLTAFTKPWAFGRLNVVERILLAQRIAEERSAVLRHLQDRLDLLPSDVEYRARLFRTALQGSALESDDALGIGNATMAATEKAVERLVAAGGGQRGMAFGFAGGPPPPPPMSAPAPAPGAPMPKPAARASGGKMKKSSRRRDEGEMQKEDASPLEDYMAEERERSVSDMEEREQIRQFFQKIDKTQELGENNYWKRRIDEIGPDLVTVNAFWRDYAKHDGKGPFVSSHVAEASRNFTEMMFALSVLDLPFATDKATTQFSGARMSLETRAPAIAFHKEIKPASPAKEAVPILVGQNYFRADDRFVTVGGERRDKYVTEEFITHVVYVAQVILTNPTSSLLKLDVLLQIPRGAIPVSNGFRTKGQAIQLTPYATQSLEYQFYFPAPGDYSHFPVHVSRNEELLAVAASTTLHVVEKPTRIDRTSWPYVSQHASSEEVLRFLEDNSIDGLDLSKIAWRLRDRKFYDQVLALLARRHVYEPTLWSYSLHHGDAPSVREYLKHREDFLRRCGLALESALISIDPVERGWYEHREYAPLVNARAHQLGDKRKILNDRLSQQWAQLMTVLSQRATLDDRDLLAVSYYLLLQDRIEEGLETFARVKSDKIESQLQLDYVRCYVAFFGDQPETARAIAQKHAEHPIDRWRNLFKTVLAQLDEATGRGAEVVDASDRTQRQTKLAATEPALELAVENKTVQLTYQNLSSVRVNYYLMDVELLFSRQPFAQSDANQFAFVKPNRSDEVALPAGSSHAFALPEAFRGANVVVEVVAGGLRKAQPYYSHALNVTMIETYGQVQVRDQKTNAPLPRVYVKVYARQQSGGVEFFKDGYTDLRGRFDYAQLSTDELDRVERFAILVLSEQHGAVIREAGPPRR